MKMYKLLVILILLACSFWNMARAEFIFGEPTIVPNLSGPNSDGSPQISRDGLELYLNYNRVQGECSSDIWVSKRQTTNDPWPMPTKLEPPVNSPVSEMFPSISADGLELYFSDGYPNLTGCEARSGGYGHTDLWVSTRASKDDLWGEPQNLGPVVNSENAEDEPCISADGLELYFMSDSPGGGSNPTNSDIFVTTRATKDSPWREPIKLSTNVNSSQYEYTPFISPDGLLLFFSRGYSKAHVWVSKRASKKDPWVPAEFFDPVNSGSQSNVWGNSSGNAEFSVSFCEADSTLYFARGSGTLKSDFDIWQMEVTPIVDFNKDGVVDGTDLSMMVDCWHTNEPLCDIAPLPMGDGFVDFQDLATLSDYVSPPLMGHWALDETEGMFASGRSDLPGRSNDGIILGDAVWESSGGQIGGALKLDGIDDYIIIPPLLNPAEEPFSIFLWVRAGKAGEVILSEYSGTNWLMLNADRRLVTELQYPGASGSLLTSDAFISDGLWHHIGFGWDGSSRKLFFDGDVVAEDVQAGLESSGSDLHIGTSGNTDAETFFTGLIDDIRVFNRVLSTKQIRGMINLR